MSTRYHSSDSIWPPASPRPAGVPRIIVSLPHAFPSTLTPASCPFLSLSPLHSVSRFARFFLRPLYTTVASSLSLAPFLTLGERVLSAFLPPVALPPSPHLILSRQPHRFTFCVPPAVSLDLASSSLFLSFVFYLSLPYARSSYQSVSVPRSVSAFSHRFSRSPSDVLFRAGFSPSVFRRGTASRSSLAMRETGLGTGRVRRSERRTAWRRRRVHVPSRSTGRNWYIGG